MTLPPCAPAWREQPSPDVPFLVVLLALLSYGLIMLFSAGYAVALYRRGDAYTYIRPQLLFAALGAAAMYAASLVDYHVWHKLAWPVMGLSLILLVVVLFMPEYNGCKRWIVLPGLGTLQPSEIAKFAVVLVFSHIISLNHDRMHSFAGGVLPFGLILGVVTVLMLLEPHLSGTLLILSIGAVLMFVGGTGLQWFGLAGGLGAGAIAAAVLALPELVPYATDRLASWRDPFADPLGEGHQTIQSLYAIASGGLAGLGLGNSRQKYLYVPEPQNDFIFSILCEELGFIGAALAVALFLALLLRGMSIAMRARDKFGALLAVGFVVQVVLQAVLKHCGRHQYHPQHRHQPAIFFLRRHQPDDAAGGNGHCTVGFPPDRRRIARQNSNGFHIHPVESCRYLAYNRGVLFNGEVCREHAKTKTSLCPAGTGRLCRYAGHTVWAAADCLRPAGGTGAAACATTPPGRSKTRGCTRNIWASSSFRWTTTPTH